MERSTRFLVEEVVEDKDEGVDGKVEDGVIESVSGLLSPISKEDVSIVARPSIESRMKAVVNGKPIDPADAKPLVETVAISSLKVHPPQHHQITYRPLPPSPVQSILDFEQRDAEMGGMSNKSLLPLETRLIYGLSPDSEAILKDMNRPESSPIDEIVPLISSAVSWLSKTPSLEEPRFMLVTPHGDAFEMGSQKKCIEFRELFPSVSQEERVIEDFTCAWLNEVLLHGRMYITENYLCFYSKVIWVYTVILPLDEIVQIEKKVVGGLFDNAMEICTSKKIKYYFTSFLYRNQAHDVLTKVIAGHPDNVVELKEMSPPETPKRASITSEGRRSRSMGSLEDTRIATKQARASQAIIDDESNKVMGLAEIVNIPVSSNLADAVNFSNTSSHIVHQKIQVSAPSAAELLKSPKKLVQSLSERPFECGCIGAVHELQKVCLDLVVGVKIEQAWDYLCSSRSVFIVYLWDKLMYTNIKMGEWVPPGHDFNAGGRVEEPGTFKSVRVGWKRRIEFVRPINNPIGPKFSKCSILETIRQVSKKYVGVLIVAKYA